MKNRRKIGFVLFVSLFLRVSSVSAQMVEVVSGYPVINVTELSPLGMVLSAAEAATRRVEMNAQTPSNSASLSVGEVVSGVNGTWNAKLSPRFQVMYANAPLADWATAYAYCKTYAGEGGAAGQWRLPTQRELQLIWILHPQLIGKGGFVSFDAASYWSSTENSAGLAWFVNFNTGGTGSYYKPYTSRVRCVRDL